MIEIIITSSVLILIIIAMRYLLRGKISSRLQYALWALVALRLLLQQISGTQCCRLRTLRRYKTVLRHPTVRPAE